MYLLRCRSEISIKWTPLVLDKSVHFMEISTLLTVHLKIKSLKLNMNSTICHDFPDPDLLQGPKDGKIKENAKILHSKVLKQGSLH